MFQHLLQLANAEAATEASRSGVSPVFNTMSVIAGIVCLLFVVVGGYFYITSSGNPEKIERAKKTLRNSFIGFVIVLGATSIVGLMQNAYQAKPVQEQQVTENPPIKPHEGNALKDMVNAAITGFVKSSVESIGKANHRYPQAVH
ncbi:MAG TPA: pilin [Verrucomicrobiae bacterium]|nr:pilin [Verrucomicrobiae bacterium]